MTKPPGTGSFSAFRTANRLGLGPAATLLIGSLLIGSFLTGGLLTGGLLAGCSAEAGEAEASETSATPSEAPLVDVAPVTFRRNPLPIQTSGRVAAKAEIDLTFKIDGVVQRVLVDEGDRVSRGALLAQLNLAEIDAQVQEAESALEKARRDLKRAEGLHQDSVATLEEVQDARTGVEVAAARVQAATFNRQYAVIDAPDKGRILKRHVEVGEYVRPGQPVVTLAAVGRGWIVRSGLPAEDVVAVSLGDSAHVVYNAYPTDTVSAQVTEIADAADPQTGTYDIELSIQGASRPLKSGFIAGVVVFPSRGEPLLEIPPMALQSARGMQGEVLRYDSTTQTVHRQMVTLERLLSESIALAEGLSPGDLVVTFGANGLSDGTSVRARSPNR